MLNIEPDLRLSLQGIRNHEWVLDNEEDDGTGHIKNVCKLLIRPPTVGFKTGTGAKNPGDWQMKWMIHKYGHLTIDMFEKVAAAFDLPKPFDYELEKEGFTYSNWEGQFALSKSRRAGVIRRIGRNDITECYEVAGKQVGLCRQLHPQ
jgi:hypothetical protein